MTWVVDGQTYEIRDQLKRLGCKWNARKGRWEAPSAAIHAAVRQIQDAHARRATDEIRRLLSDLSVPPTQQESEDG